MDLREQLVGPMRLPNESRQTALQHPLDASLGLGEKASAEQHDHERIEGAKPSERFFAVHKRHRQIEEDNVEPVRALPELLETFETRFDGRDLVASFGKDAIRQKARRGFVIDY